MAGLAKAATPLRAALLLPSAARLFSSSSAASSPAAPPTPPPAAAPSSAPSAAASSSSSVAPAPAAGSNPPAPSGPPAQTKASRFTLDPSSTPTKFPHGFLATGLHCGVKKDRAKLDLAVIISDRPCSAAGTFTRNAFVAAPVVVSQDVLARGKGVARGLVVNSGCANAVTGTQGLADARAMSDQLDSFLSASSSSSGTGTLVMSTGVIGQLLPIPKILQGIEASTATLASNFNAWSDCARAFMTTDTFPKLRTRTFQLAGKEVRMVGIDKGAGMIHPNMGPPAPPRRPAGPPHATMLGVIATDAAVEPASLQSALTYAVDRSFNSISVDGDMSTNDTVVALANGASGTSEISELKTPDEYVKFRDELTSFAAELAQLVVRDGEGAEKFVKVTVQVRPLSPSRPSSPSLAPDSLRLESTPELTLASHPAGCADVRGRAQGRVRRLDLVARQVRPPRRGRQLGPDPLRRRLLAAAVRDRPDQGLGLVRRPGRLAAAPAPRRRRARDGRRAPRERAPRGRGHRDRHRAWARRRDGDVLDLRPLARVHLDQRRCVLSPSVSLVLDSS